MADRRVVEHGRDRGCHLDEVVGWDRSGPVDQQIRDAPEVSGDRGEADSCVLRVRRRVPVDRTEIAVAIDQRVAQPELLGETDQRGVVAPVVAHHLGRAHVPRSEPRETPAAAAVETVVDVRDLHAADCARHVPVPRRLARVPV
jgi:hypothetical protein